MTSKCWPAKLGAAVAKAGFVFSLMLAAGMGGAQTYREIERRLDGAETPAQVREALRGSRLPEGTDATFRSAVERARAGRAGPDEVARLKQMARIRAELEGAPLRTAPQDLRQQAERIKSSPVYRDDGPGGESNWLAKAWQRLMSAFGRRASPPNIEGVQPMRLDWLVPLMWMLLGGVVVAFLTWAIMQFRFKLPKRKRKVGGLLEDDEPDRTADEWLTEAEALRAAGKYREAMRCLYLACLMRFDEHGVARFERSETNWEHFRRIASSARRPAEIDFRPTTQTFDRVWYGRQVKGETDYQSFREVYERICAALAKQPAA